MFVYESSDGNVYSNPDEFILDQKYQTIPWGTKLKVWPVFEKGSQICSNYQEIYAMFYHEGNEGNISSTYWVPRKHDGFCDDDFCTNDFCFDDIKKPVDMEKLVYFPIDSDHPRYFKTVLDLMNYFENIYLE